MSDLEPNGPGGAAGESRVTEDTDVRARPKMIEKLNERRGTHKQRHSVIRALYVVVGATLVLGGIVMLVAPGPAFVVIPAGLFILALEFTWAERALERSLEQAEAAKRKAANASGTQRLLTAAAAALAAAGVVVWGVWGDIPVLPF